MFKVVTVLRKCSRGVCPRCFAALKRGKNSIRCLFDCFRRISVRKGARCSEYDEFSDLIQVCIDAESLRLIFLVRCSLYRGGFTSQPEGSVSAHTAGNIGPA